jgi:hypothetical protein
VLANCEDAENQYRAMVSIGTLIWGENTFKREFKSAPIYGKIERLASSNIAKVAECAGELITISKSS